MNRRDFILTTAAAVAAVFIPTRPAGSVCEPETQLGWSGELAERIREALCNRRGGVESVLVLSPRMAVGYKHLLRKKCGSECKKATTVTDDVPNCDGYAFVGKRIVVDTSPSAPAWRWEYADALA